MLLIVNVINIFRLGMGAYANPYPNNLNELQSERYSDNRYIFGIAPVVERKPQKD